MKLLKNSMLMGVAMMSVMMTSCLKGGNTASFAVIGTVESDMTGVTLINADNGAGIVRPIVQSSLGDASEGQRVLCNLSINYDEQPSQAYTYAEVSGVQQLKRYTMGSVPSVSDSLTAEQIGGQNHIVANIVPLSSVSFSVQNKIVSYYLNLNLIYNAEKAQEGPTHAFDFILDEKRTAESDRDIYFYVVHNDGGEKPGTAVKNQLATMDITSLVKAKQEGIQGRVLVTYKKQKDQNLLNYATIEVPFMKYKENL